MDRHYKHLYERASAKCFAAKGTELAPAEASSAANGSGSSSRPVSGEDATATQHRASSHGTATEELEALLGNPSSDGSATEDTGAGHRQGSGNANSIAQAAMLRCGWVERSFVRLVVSAIV